MSFQGLPTPVYPNADFSKLRKPFVPALTQSLVIFFFSEKKLHNISVYMILESFLAFFSR